MLQRLRQGSLQPSRMRHLVRAGTSLLLCQRLGTSSASSPPGVDFSSYSEAMGVEAEQLSKAKAERDPNKKRGRRVVLPAEQETLKRLIHGQSIPTELSVTCRSCEEKKIDWIDITSATGKDISGAEWSSSVRSMLHSLGVPTDDLFMPSNYLLLPHTSVIEGCHTLLLRYATREIPPVGQHTIQNLTNRIAIYILKAEISAPAAPPPMESAEDPRSVVSTRSATPSPADTPPLRTVLITAHRCSCFCVEELHEHWEQHISAPNVLSQLLYFLVKRVLGSFTVNLWRCLIDFDGYETNLFHEDLDRELMTRRIYDIKRRVAVFERCLSLTQDAYAHMIASLPVSFKDRRYFELQHRLANAEGLAKDLCSDAESALQLIFQLSSYEVNELMRFLTLFSAFFIPLNFISSVYGMNIVGLPFTENENGGLYLSGVFAVGIVLLLSWFRRKKFV